MNRWRLDPWIEGYLEYLRDIKRLVPRSIIDMRCTLGKVARHLEARRPGVALWRATLDDYLVWMSHERDQGASEAALDKCLSHLRGLLEYSSRSGRADRNVLDGFTLQDRIVRREPRVLTLEEARRIVHAYDRHNAAERRCRLVILLLYGCGLRTAELCGLDVGDIDIERQTLFVRRGKGGIQRHVPVPDAVWVELLAYLTERATKRGPLFRTLAKRRRIDSPMVGEIVRDAANRAGLVDVTPKTLRHTFGTHLMDRGVDLGVIAVLMGHRSPHETGVYLHTLPGRKEQAVERLGRESQR
jgi:site-specific recombinase XerD